MEAFSTVGEALLRAHKYHHAKSCQDLLCDIERRFRAISRWEPDVWRGFAIRANDEQHRRDSFIHGIHGKTASATFGDPDVSCFLLLDDPANELFLSVRLGTDCVLIRWARLNREKVYPICSRFSGFRVAMRRFGQRPYRTLPISLVRSSVAFQHRRDKQYPNRCRLSASWLEMRGKVPWGLG